MKILKGIYTVIQYILLAIINPFDTFTFSKGTKGTSEFMGKNVWIVILIALIVTGCILFIGYYDSLFKGILSL